MKDLPKTLAELLAVDDPRTNEPMPQPYAEPRSAKEFARQCLGSPEYRASIFRRILTDELSPQMECRLWDYAWGKPLERMQIEDKSTNLEDAPVELLEQRMKFLLSIIKTKRMNDVQVEEPDDGPSTDSIH